MMTIKDVYTKIVNLITPPLPLPPAGLFCAWKLDGGGVEIMFNFNDVYQSTVYCLSYCIKGLYNAAFLCRC